MPAEAGIASQRAGLQSLIDEEESRLEAPGFTGDNLLACISSSRCFVFSHVFFSGLGSCMHFPYFSGCAEVFLPNMRASLTRRLCR